MQEKQDQTRKRTKRRCLGRHVIMTPLHFQNHSRFSECSAFSFPHAELFWGSYLSCMLGFRRSTFNKTQQDTATGRRHSLNKVIFVTDWHIAQTSVPVTAHFHLIWRDQMENKSLFHKMQPNSWWIEASEAKSHWDHKILPLENADFPHTPAFWVSSNRMNWLCVRKISLKKDLWGSPMGETATYAHVQTHLEPFHIITWLSTALHRQRFLLSYCSALTRIEWG